MPNEDKIRDMLDSEPAKGSGLFNSLLGEYLLSKSFASKVSIVAMLFAFYSGVNYHEPVQRVKDYVLNHNIQVEQGYFEDPRGLDIQLSTNDHGRREVYLRHEDSNSYRAIKKDMLPETDTMLTGIEDRLSEMDAEKRERVYERLEDMQHEY